MVAGNALSFFRLSFALGSNLGGDLLAVGGGDEITFGECGATTMGRLGVLCSGCGGFFSGSCRVSIVVFVVPRVTSCSASGTSAVVLGGGGKTLRSFIIFRLFGTAAASVVMVASLRLRLRVFWREA